MNMKRNAIFGSLLAAGLIVLFVLIFHHDALAPKATPSGASTTNNSVTKTGDNTPATFNKSQFSLTDPASIWVVVNKHRPLDPKNYAPSDLVTPNVPKRSNITSDERQMRKIAANALEQMVAAAKTDNINLNLQSGYRSYDFQVTLYNRYVQQQGQASADSQSARPGFSEHQTGLAADLGGTTRPGCNVESCYADTAEGKWLAEHAYEYGFIIRYPAGKTSVTGYVAEPWHIRYVGVELAREMHLKGVQTLEELFGLEAAPDYK
jgi:D-alanyl-D-alanine carboxypeptidase